MIQFLKWFFSSPGIQYTMRRPYQLVLFGRNILWFNRHFGVGYLPNGPGDAELKIWVTMERMLHRTFKPYECSICGTTIWSYRPVKVCESFKCFVANGGKWR